MNPVLSFSYITPNEMSSNSSVIPVSSVNSGAIALKASAHWLAWVPIRTVTPSNGRSWAPAGPPSAVAAEVTRHYKSALILRMSLPPPDAAASAAGSCCQKSYDRAG